MMNGIFNSSTLPLLEKLAAFGERRQEVLAGNLANIDTPNYTPRDLSVEDFQQAMQAAIERRSRPASAGDAPPNPVTGSRIDDLFPAEMFHARPDATRNLTFQDGANRSVEKEVMELTKNSMMQRFAVELMVAQMSMLQTAISERPL